MAPPFKELALRKTSGMVMEVTISVMIQMIMDARYAKVS
jgi:hypothetical protein